MWRVLNSFRQLLERLVRNVSSRGEKLFDTAESRFRRMLKMRIPGQCCSDDRIDSATRFGKCVEILRQVLHEQLDLPNICLADDLIKYISDIPEEEILLEALEKLGCKATPKYSSWDGTFNGLVCILEETIAADESKLIG